MIVTEQNCNLLAVWACVSVEMKLLPNKNTEINYCKMERVKLNMYGEILKIGKMRLLDWEFLAIF